jgi:tripartite-type tricarboxylate transporter receptor subunit TctC
VKSVSKVLIFEATMNHPFIAWLRLALALVLLCAASAYAQTAYPTRPIRMVIQFAPGGSDVVARILTQRMSEAMGQSFVIDNRPGAAGVIASGIVAKSAPDGYTLLFPTASFAVTPAFERNLPYDSVKDFDAVGFIGSQPFILVVHPAIPATTLKEFIALAKVKPLTFASAGAGGIGHLAHEYFNHLTGIKSTHVPYKGTGPMVAALLGGEINAAMINLLGAYAHAKAGRLRALGITTVKRSGFAPELPTLAETGLTGYESATWYGVSGPRGMPRAVIDTLNREMAAALKTDIKDKIAALGVDLAPSTPQAFGAYMRDEIAKWGRVVKLVGMKVE